MVLFASSGGRYRQTSKEVIANANTRCEGTLKVHYHWAIEIAIETTIVTSQPSVLCCYTKPFPLMFAILIAIAMLQTNGFWTHLLLLRMLTRFAKYCYNHNRQRNCSDGTDAYHILILDGDDEAENLVKLFECDFPEDVILDETEQRNSYCLRVLIRQLPFSREVWAVSIHVLQ